MYKTKTISVLTLLATTGLLGLMAPAQADIIKDAAATCGSRLMFSADRTFDNATSPERIDRIYGCVDSYLKGLPEYDPSAATAAADQQFIASVRQIDIGRATGQLTAAQAQAQMQSITAAHKSQ